MPPPNNSQQRPTGMKFNDGREATLHSQIMSQRSTLQNSPTAVLAAINASPERMMTFKGPKLAAARSALEAMSPPPKIIVELGTYIGCSAIGWGSILSDIWADQPDVLKNECKVYACELDEGIASIAKDFVGLAGLEGVVEVCAGRKAGETLKALVVEGKLGKGKVDVLFFDHWEEFYLPDLQLAEELGVLRKGGLLVADNTDMPGAPKYLAYVRAGGSGKEGGYKFETESVSTASPGSRGPSIVEITKVVEAP
ncbi:hypothetical protein BT63DRAFT_482444 [Microthyrium microscopicum]|uniref:catechol O-methyltransferase n=1 Tax=Microthyrium microscopicum TaxID=703497 RepID=A0A6A6U261_9PEZI|nr:hypothetical protein BT63DRAFT_482444 [Microthyrium microscopicum]